MKVRLLNSGGYSTNGKIEFPVVVEGRHGNRLIGFEVKGSELKRVGFTFVYAGSDYYFSSFCGHCELIEEVK